MLLRSAFCLVIAAFLVGCASPEEKAKKAAAKKEQPLKNQVDDTAFLAFLGRLRTAVAKKDLSQLSQMMTPDFGYRWDNPPVGDNIFTYWDLNGTWPELQHVLQEKFVPNGEYLVAPATVMANSDYRGFRAGMRLVHGAWRFAYFVPGEGPLAR